MPINALLCSRTRERWTAFIGTQAYTIIPGHRVPKTTGEYLNWDQMVIWSLR